MDVAQLIMLVRNYPELYNTHHPEYFNNVRRGNCWEEIGFIMNEQGSVCKDRWTKVRDNYRKALQRRKTKNDRGATNTKPPKYEKELTFLAPYLTNDDNRQSNFDPDESATDTVHNVGENEFLTKDEPLSPTTQILCQPSPVFNKAHSSSSMSSSGPRYTHSVSRKRKRSINRTEKTAVSVLDEYLYKKRRHAQRHMAEDPLTCFFITMAKTVQGFPVRDQIELKQKIFNLITEKEIDITSRASSGEYHVPLKTENVTTATESTLLTPQLFQIQEKYNCDL